MVQNNMCFTGRCASLARYMNERAQNCTKFTQAFDTPHSIGRCSSGFVCDESKLPKILAPGACSDVHLLFFLVCFCLAEKKKCVLQVSRDFFLIKGLSKGWRCKLTRLLFIVILTWPDSTMQKQSAKSPYDKKQHSNCKGAQKHVELKKKKKSNKSRLYEDIIHLSNDLLRVAVHPGGQHVNYLHSL